MAAYPVPIPCPDHCGPALSWRTWSRPTLLLTATLLLAATLVLVGTSLSAQLINEVIARNSNERPPDIRGGFPDMVEIYNDTDEQLALGEATVQGSYALSDTLEFDPSRIWVFPRGRSTIPAGGRMTIFCDGNLAEGFCEPHSSFSISSDGSEVITLWGPTTNGEDDGPREAVDRVYLPPLGNDVSWGRFPDGAGGPLLAPEDHLAEFVYYPPGRSSFGSCVNSAGLCQLNQLSNRLCLGARNRAPLGTDNLEPTLSRIAESTNVPAANEPVEFTVRVRDDSLPTTENIARVEIVYRVRPSGGEFGPEQTILMTIDTSQSADGLLDGSDRGRPLDIFSHWNGAIPGQSAGSRVEFYFRVEDSGGLSTTRPRRLCHLMTDVGYSEGDGPCDREFGSPGDDAGCLEDVDDEPCGSAPDPGDDDDDDDDDFLFANGGGAGVVSGRYISCSVRSTYKVEHVPAGNKGAIVVNEVVPAQTHTLLDPSETTRCEQLPDGCDVLADEDCCHKDEDFVELHNSAEVAVDISGCYLSDSFFQPQTWRFPVGSIIPPGAYVIVWLDRDGSKCPNPDRLDPPCFWECPDPNVLSMQREPPQFHASFAVNADGDQLFLYDDEAGGFGLIHGVDFGSPPDLCGFTPGENPQGLPTADVRPDQSLSLVPDGDPSGTFVIVEESTPEAPNVEPQDACDGGAEFRRGDPTADAVTDISDGVFVLNFLFSGGPAPVCLDAADSDDNAAIELSDAVNLFSYLFLGGSPPPQPGPVECGPDPTDDTLVECEYGDC